MSKEQAEAKTAEQTNLYKAAHEYHSKYYRGGLSRQESDRFFEGIKFAGQFISEDSISLEEILIHPTVIGSRGQFLYSEEQIRQACASLQTAGLKEENKILRAELKAVSDTDYINDKIISQLEEERDKYKNALEEIKQMGETNTPTKYGMSEMYGIALTALNR